MTTAAYKEKPATERELDRLFISRDIVLSRMNKTSSSSVKAKLEKERAKLSDKILMLLEESYVEPRQ